MGNPFDSYAQRMFTVVSRTMGDLAVWIPADGSAPDGITARVLFSNPTRKTKLSEVEYNPLDWQMEFRVESFIGLKTSVDAGNAETITVNGSEYFVKSVISKWDGDISLAKLEPQQ